MARRLFQVLMGLAGVLGIVVVVCLAVQPTLPLDWLFRWLRPDIEAALGQPVELVRPRLTLALHPALQVDELHVSDPELSASNLFLRVSLPALLGGVGEVSEASIEDLRVVLPTDAKPAEAAPVGQGNDRADASPMPLHLPRCTVDRLRIILPDHQRIEVESLEAQAPLSGHVRLRGSVRWASHAAAVAVEGGTLAELLNGQDAWPISAVATSDVGSITLDGRLGAGWRDPTAQSKFLLNASGLPGWEAEGQAWSLAAGSSAELHLTWKGTDWVTILESAGVRGQMEAVRLSYGGELLEVDQAGVTRHTGQPWQVTAVGRAANQPFHLAGRLELPLRWPLEGPITADGRVRWGGSGLSGSVSWSPGADPARDQLRLELGGRGPFPIAGFGSVDRFDQAKITASWKGRSIIDLVQTLRAKAMVHGVALSLGPDLDRMTNVQVPKLNLNWRAGGEAHGSIDAQVRDMPIAISFRSSAPAAWPPTEPWEVHATVEAASTKMEMSCKGDREEVNAELAVAMGATRVWGEWLGVNGLPDLPLDLHASVQRRAARWTAVMDDLRWGRSRARVRGSGGPGPPLIEVDLSTLQADEISAAPPSADREDAGSSGRTIDWAAPILPSWVHIPDAEVVIRIAEVAGLAGEVGEIDCRLHSADGRLAQSTFGMNLGGCRWEGTVSGDFRRDAPVVELSVHAKDVDIHELWRLFGDSSELEVHGRQVDARVRIQGPQWGDVIRETVVSLDVHEVECRVPRPQGMLQVDLPRLSLVRNRQRWAAQAGLRINDVDLDFEVVRSPPQPLPGGRSVWPLEGYVNVAGLETKCAGTLTTPMADLNVDLNVEASLDDGQWFGRALALSAAPTGPVKLRARLQGRQGEYALNEIEASLGHSVLAGHAALAMTSDGLTWSLDLTSPSLELTDFQLTNLTAKGSAPAPAGDRATVVSGSFTLAADDVMAAGTSLGRLHTELRMGTSGITVDVFRLQSDHHGVEARCEQRVGAERIEVKADATISNFSYGVLSPLVPALSGREGRVYLDGELSAVGRPGESLLPRLKGNLGFAYFPEGIRSDLLDLWAVGLLRAVALPFTGGNRSQVQCIAGRFDVSDGVWKPRTFYLDTSRIRVRGTGTIDPVRDRIRFKLKPRPKRRAFIHLATPVVIRGKVSKPNVDISRSGLVVTAARLYFWAVTAIDSLLRREIPEHDFDGYMKMMKGEHP